MAPSRELAMQIVRVAQALLPEAARRGVQQAIGGANIWRQRDALKVGEVVEVGSVHATLHQPEPTSGANATRSRSGVVEWGPRMPSSRAAAVPQRARDGRERLLLDPRPQQPTHKVATPPLQAFKPFMVVGTPGRLAELSRDGSLQTHK